MRTIFSLLLILSWLVSVRAGENINARDAKIDNMQLHYLTAGNAPATVICCMGLRKRRGCGDQ